MKKLSVLFGVLAVVLSHAMCIVVTWCYRDMICGVMHAGYSAPSEVAFFFVIPFAIPILICVVLSIIFYRKARRG